MLNQINGNSNQKSNVLPFRITAVRIPLDALDEILGDLQIASFHLNADWQLDWEDRQEACRAIYNALTTLRELKELKQLTAEVLK